MNTTIGQSGSPDPVLDPLSTLESRLDFLERENTHLRKQSKLLTIGGAAGLAVLAVLALAWVISAFGSDSTGVLEATKVVLRDANGIERGVWEVTESGGSRLVLRDHDARERIRLTLLPDGSPGLTLADRDGRSRTVLGLLPDQTATLVFADQAGKTRAVLGVPADGSSTMAFADRQGETRVNVGVDAAGKPSVTMFENATPAVEEPLAPIEEAEAVPAPQAEEPQASPPTPAP